MEDTRVTRKLSLKPANDNAAEEREPWFPHERLDYWLRKVANIHGMTRTEWHCDLVNGRYDAYIVVESKRLLKSRLARVATVQAREGQNIDSAMRLLAWKLEDMCHVE